MKLLNLDEITVNSERTVQWKGVKYAVKDFDVEEFIAFNQHFSAFSKAYNGTTIEEAKQVVEETKNLVRLGIPGFPVDEVSRMNPVQMMAVVSMIANLMPGPDEETKEGIEAEEKKE